MISRSSCFLLSLLALPAIATADAGESKPWKLTVADYRYSDGSDGQDVNLRWRREDTNVWVGTYHDQTFGSQARTGFDTSIALGGSATLQPSLQAASRGFFGGSLNLQVGDPWYVLVGWGRTNLKPYFNLNFDPNDAITLGAGWHGEGGRSIALSVIADDRLHTGQKDWHLYGRWPVAADLRMTLDLMRKTGQGDGGSVHAWGLIATLDFPSWFVRVAHDPKQNFSALDATRLAAGLRF
ncbi:hypothetical protein [Piscinibacter terrae]|uniref:Cellulose biosynthesis protein BcsS n=1 Tax=Piscinibacter terrae TaxID=2496871 RepID=A0A3N7JKM8_9BURK|nr:hypothetical protein [Albitalea terrae]RQP21859.1 hypothetical protein DZC73_25815 [Albitalea terrae]